MKEHVPISYRVSKSTIL